MERTFNGRSGINGRLSGGNSRPQYRVMVPSLEAFIHVEIHRQSMIYKRLHHRAITVRHTSRAHFWMRLMKPNDFVSQRFSVELKRLKGRVNIIWIAT